MAVDLHTHSTASDGSDSPERDRRPRHRTTSRGGGPHGSRHAGGDPGSPAGRREHRDAADLRASNSRWSGRPARMHMLAYFLEPGPGPSPGPPGRTPGRHGWPATERWWRRSTAWGSTSPSRRSRRRREAAQSGRPHIAALLIRKGAVHSMAEAFDKYLADGRPAYRSRPRLEAAEAAALTRASGGVAVVAHPHTVAGRTESFADAFAAFTDIGVSGIECHYSEYAPEIRTRLAAMAARLRVDRHRRIRLPRLLQAGTRSRQGPRRPGGARRGIRGTCSRRGAKARADSADTPLYMADTATTASASATQDRAERRPSPTPTSGSRVRRLPTRPRRPPAGSDHHVWLSWASGSWMPPIAAQILIVDAIDSPQDDRRAVLVLHGGRGDTRLIVSANSGVHAPLICTAWPTCWWGPSCWCRPRGTLWVMVTAAAAYSAVLPSPSLAPEVTATSRLTQRRAVGCGSSSAASSRLPLLMLEGAVQIRRRPVSVRSRHSTPNAAPRT